MPTARLIAAPLDREPEPVAPRVSWQIVLTLLGMAGALAAVYGDSRSSIGANTVRIDRIEKAQDRVDAKLDRILERLSEKR